jgi:hypothetical protein
MDILEILQNLDEEHYPGRLSAIYVVGINMSTISKGIKAKFKEIPFFNEKVKLFDSSYKKHLMRYFDPYELSVDYGGFAQKKYEPGSNIKKSMLSMLKPGPLCDF